MSKIDLHIHSCFSDDADFHPNELIDMAKRENVKVISIADHDTCEAYRHFDYKNVNGIEVIPAIELDCTIDGVNLHVLGYGIDPLDEEFIKIHHDIMEQEKSAGLKRIELIKKLGIILDEDEVIKAANGKVITGELIAELALNDPRNNDCALLEPYRKGNSRSDNPYVNFYWDFCASQKEAYVLIEYITLVEAIKIIKQSKGIAVLAHPGNNIHEDEALLDKIMGYGIDGIEVYSSYHSDKQVEFYHQKALEYGCLITCGSDFHGKTKPSIKIGCPVTKESFEELNERLKSCLSKGKND